MTFECKRCSKPVTRYKKGSGYCSPKCYHDDRTIPIVDGKKRCSKCKENKAVSEFHIGRKSGQSQCKLCQSNRVRGYEPQLFICPECNKEFTRRVKPDRKTEKPNRICGICIGRKKMIARGGHSHNYTGTEHIAGRLYAGWKCSADRRSIGWEVTLAELESLYVTQGGICALSGIRLETDSKSPYRASLDRKDSDGPYEIGNLQFVCSVINVMKNKLPDATFAKLCKSVADHFAE